MTDLNKGDKAPDFTLKNQKGEEVSLKDFSGKKVVLYFYPKDDTPGCTKEAINLRENHERLQKEGFVILGVSPDDVKSHDKFSCKYDLPFNLLADTEKEVLQKYNAYGEKNMYGIKRMGVKRSTYVIDENGKIEAVIKKVRTDDHADQVLEKVNGK